MDTKENCNCNHMHKKNKVYKASSGEAIYGFGMVGAAVYFVQSANNFSSVLIGILKAFAWPAVIVYKALQMLGL